MLERILDRLALFLVWMASFFLAAMMLNVFLDVLLKYVFNRPIPGTAEIVARWYMVAAVFLPLPYVESRNSGISVDLFYNLFSSNMRRVTIAVAYVGQSLFFGLLAYQSSFDAYVSTLRGEFIDGQIRVIIWPAFYFLPIGLWLAAAFSILRLFQIFFRPDWEQITDLRPSTGSDRATRESI